MRFLEAVIHADGAPAGFAGAICVGVKGTVSTSWWLAECSRDQVTRISKPIPMPRFDVGLGLDTVTADWILARAPKPGALKILTGNRAVFDHFLNRFLRRSGVVGVRLFRGKDAP